jgi:hypothetical protein
VGSGKGKRFRHFSNRWRATTFSWCRLPTETGEVMEREGIIYSNNRPIKMAHLKIIELILTLEEDQTREEFWESRKTNFSHQTSRIFCQRW